MQSDTVDPAAYKTVEREEHKQVAARKLRQGQDRASANPSPAPLRRAKLNGQLDNGASMSIISVVTMIANAKYDRERVASITTFNSIGSDVSSDGSMVL